MNEKNPSKYWLDQVVAEIIKQHPTGEIIVSSGVAPSGIYHVGHLREVLTADAMALALKLTKRQVKHLHFVDDLDPLRKIPAGVPESFKEHIGKPLSAVPDPWDCHSSYSEHFLADFLEVVKPLQLEMEVLRSHQIYQEGVFAQATQQVESKLEDIKQIITEVSGRNLPEDWTPIERYGDGQAKLAWRLDWPARWAIYKVQVEPFGRDHATKGGSYDTGQQLVRAVFNGEAPYPVPYEFINPKGQTKKMSASAGTGLTPADVLKVMPAEVLRYFILRSRPERMLQFDSGLGLYNLVEEYSKVEAAVKKGEEHEFAEAYLIASSATDQQTVSQVPFSHMVAVYQAAQGEPEAVFDILKRTGYQEAVEKEKTILGREIEYVRNWLAKYAPDEVKFSVQDELPKVELSAEQKQFLAAVAESLGSKPEPDGQQMHDLIYEAKEKVGLEPGAAFQAIYRVILGQDSGPKAGWFLATLDQHWLIDRLRLKK